MLGFRFEDIQILLISHSHWDHAAGSAEVKRLTKAKFMAMSLDIPEIEDGGRSNYKYESGPAPPLQGSACGQRSLGWASSQTWQHRLNGASDGRTHKGVYDLSAGIAG